MVIHQGDIYWIDLDAPAASEPGFRRPAVIIQNDTFNQSRINTTVICTLSSNLNRANAPGNVLLNPEEANLPRQSVVLISQIFTVDKSQLAEYIGTLSNKRVLQILEGLKLLTEPDDV